jgi:phage protein D
MSNLDRFGTRPEITVDGSPLREEVATLVEQVIVDCSVHLADMVEVWFRDPERDAVRRAGIRIGSKLTISTTRAGDGSQTPLVEAEVTALECEFDEFGTRAVVRGYDHAHRLSRGRRTHSYNDVTDADIVTTVARRAGLSVGDVASGGPVHEHVAQLNCTDWEFLLGRARETGHEVAVLDGALHWRKPAQSSDAPSAASDLEPRQPRQLVLGTNLLRFRPRITAAAQVGEVEVRGWDPQRKQAVIGRSSAATTSATVGLDPAGLASTFDAPSHVAVDHPLSTQTEADATAAALAETLASAHAEADGVALGDPRIVPNAAVVISGAEAPFDGTYSVTAVRHRIDEFGYRTEFTVSGRAERSLLGLASGGATNGLHRAGGQPIYGVVVGQVTDVNDPDDLGRVKLKFPWLSDDYESWWARVAQLGAGPQRGAVWLPEVNDEVLVAFEHGDSRRPYVVGQLYNGVDTPELGDGLIDGASGAVKRRGFVSKVGHRLVFLDDDSKSGVAVLSSDDKLKIALNQTSTTIKISADGSVEISGSQQVTISSDGAVSIQAGSTLELKGKSGVTIDGGPQVGVTGSVIKLN